jgi:hypothetical protein
MRITALYESVTNRIIEEMKNGTVPWTKPWKSGKTIGVMPMNAVTGRAYSGINIPLLWHAADVHAYPTHRWLTYKQALAVGGQVRKGQKSTTVVFTKKLRIKDKDTDEDKQIGMLKTFAVFNEAQIEGLPSTDGHREPEHVHNLTNVDSFITATKADIRIGGNVACYVPSRDFIALPPLRAFMTIQSFYAKASRARSLDHAQGPLRSGSDGPLRHQGLRGRGACGRTHRSVPLRPPRHQEPAFSEMFVSHLLARTIRVEADLVDQLFNSSEKRLARALLLLANFGKEGRPEQIVAKISQETLAEMIGTTRARVSFFMNKFRKLGLIDYNGHLEIHSSLLNVVLHDEPHINN